MAAPFILSDNCTTCGCPNFHTDEFDKAPQGDVWRKIHDQKISNSAKTFTFSPDAVSTGSKYSKPTQLADDNIFKITAYPVIQRSTGATGGGGAWHAGSWSYPDDCEWKSGGVTLDNSFARDQSGDNINALLPAGLKRETGERFSGGQVGGISGDSRVSKSWGWGFAEGTGTYSSHYRNWNKYGGYNGYIHNDAGLDTGAMNTGAIFVYLDKTKITFGEIPSWLQTSISPHAPTTDPNNYQNPHNVRPHANRHFIDRTEGDSITGQIDNITDGTTTGGVDRRGDEWVVELWVLESALPSRRYETTGTYLVSNQYPNKRIAAIRWRRWTASSITDYWLEGGADWGGSSEPAGYWFWPLWQIDIDLPSYVDFTDCGTEVLQFPQTGAGMIAAAPWGWTPENEYFNPADEVRTAVGTPNWPNGSSFGNAAIYNSPNGSQLNYYVGGSVPAGIGATGNYTFATGGSFVGNTSPNDPSTTMPTRYLPAGQGMGLVRQNLLDGAHVPDLKDRGGLWPMLTAQPLFEDGTTGYEMRMGANSVRAMRFMGLRNYTGSAVVTQTGWSGVGCNAHTPNNFRGENWQYYVNEGDWQKYMRLENLGVENHATCWQIDFSPVHPQNRQVDAWETCVRADGAFFHQDPLAPNFGCP